MSMRRKVLKQKVLKIDITKYDCALAPFDWYVQFQIRREVLGYLNICEGYGYASDPLDARVQRLLKTISANPIIELETLGKCGFNLYEFSHHIMYLIAEGCTPPVFVIRNRNFVALLHAFDGTVSMFDETVIEIPGRFDYCWLKAPHILLPIQLSINQVLISTSLSAARILRSISMACVSLPSIRTIPTK